jgi:para-nitrobenzyl esterase
MDACWLGVTAMVRSKSRRVARIVCGGLCGLAFLAPALPAAAHADTPALTVRTAEGAVHGATGKGVLEFRGIPFAAPPVSDLRFAPPAPVKPWSGVLDATAYRDACPQARRFNLTEESNVEDCLHVNVAVPTAPYRGPRAVLVWFYGGAFVGGSTKLYPIDFLAREGDMVVVSVNYRLGPLGFMAHPAFAAEANGGYALEDQRAALRWVQRNIAAFGGDPGNVTIGGVSAGAASVCMHLVAPQSTTGLFQKAIVQSAGCSFHMRNLEEGQQAGLALAKLVGCDDPKTALACLRSKPVKALVDAGTTVASSDYRAFAPIYGNGTVPQQSADAFKRGEFVRVPILNGGASNEMRLYVGYEVEAGGKITPENYKERLRALYGDNVDTVLAAYPLTRYSSPPTALGSAMSDFMPSGGLNGCLFVRTAWLASRFVPVYQYEFADDAAPPVMNDPGFELGAVHTSEMPYQFPGFSNTSVLNGPSLAPPQRELARQMVAYWSSFVRTGRPAGAGLPEWQPFDPSRQALRLKPGAVGMFDASAAHQCALWERLYPEELSR